MATDGKTIVFFPEGAFGPTNNCVGIGEVLQRGGHRVVFVIEESFAGTLEEKGFEERLMRLAPPPEVEEEPGQFWKDFIRETAPVFRKSTFDQLGEFMAPTWQALIDGARYVDERLVEIFDELQPDVIVEDNVCAFPAIPASGHPWVRIVSCNPLELKDSELPPPYTGLPIDDSSEWDSLPRRVPARHRRDAGRLQPVLRAARRPAAAAGGDDPRVALAQPLPLPARGGLPALELSRAHLAQPRVERSHNRRRVGARPASSPTRDGSLVYVSLGSLGSGDVPLMKNLVDALAETPQRYIVSKGPQHAEYELADNMVGEEFLPQVSVLPEVDLVITHGGNNTTTECLHFGKPMILLPIFWDQHDNAQRIDETGFGRRLPTYSFEPPGAVGGDRPAARRHRSPRAPRDGIRTASRRARETSARPT